MSIGSAHAAHLKGYWEFASAASGGVFSGVMENGVASPNLVIEGAAPTFSASKADDATPTPVTTLNGVITTAAAAAANRLKLTHGITPNGGSTTLVNKYSMMFDVFSPTASRGQWRTFFQANPANTDDGEFFIRNSGTAETLGVAEINYSTTTMSPGKWHRVVLTFDLGTSITSYVDGVLLKSHSASTLNSHYALQSSILVFGDNDGDNKPLNVGAVAIWDGTLSASEVAALGKAGATVSTVPPPNVAPTIVQGSSTTLNAVKNGASTATLSASDPEGDALTWSLTTPAAHGTAQVTGSNTTCPISYTPAAGYTGTDSFVVQVTDGITPVSITVYVLVMDSNTAPQVVGYWQFDDASNRNKATVGFDLQPSGSGFTAVTGITAGDGAMEVAVGSFYKVTHGVPVSGGSFANRYTVMWDIKIPAASAAIFKNLFQTSVGNSSDGDLFINLTNNIGTTAGLGGYSSSALSTDTWYRVVLSVDDGVARNVYVNGTKVLTGSVGALDDRYSLLGQFLAFADDDGEDGAIDVSNMAVFNGVLTDNQITLLGAPGTSLATALPQKPAPDGLWMFNEPTKPEAATIGTRLSRNGNGFSQVSGTAAGDGAMEIAAGSNYIVNHGIAANGGGTKVNEYSVLWDVKYPAAGTAKSLYQTTLANTDDSELKINAAGNIGHGGIGGFSSQATLPVTWYRVVMVVKNGTDRSLYVNGSLWYDGSAGVVDDSCALDPAGFLAFADDDGEDSTIDVTNLAVWGRALSLGEVLVLGSTSVAVADNVTAVTPNTAPAITEGDTYTLNVAKDGEAQTTTLHGTDADNDPLLWSTVTPAAHGTVQLTANSGICTVSYTPAAGYVGLDAFTVQVSDGWASDNITFSATVTDPTAQPVLTIVAAHGTATPASGTYSNARGTALTNSVTDEGNASTRFHCIGWNMIGDGPHSGTASTMNMTLTRDSTLTWLWQTEQYVTTAISGSGTVNVASGWHQAGVPLQIVATPAAGQYFVNWSGDTTGCSIGGKTILLPMDRAYGTITANFATSENFTVVALPDTQNYCWITSDPLIFSKQTQWVVDNKDTLNIKFLTHLGDIVDSASATAQWTRATNALDLLNNKLPYGVCTGNHDLANGDTNYITRFGPSQPRWTDPGTGQLYSWYQGASPRGYSSYQVLKINGRDYMFLHLDCDSPNSDLAWAASVLAAHPRTVTMLTTHDFMAETGASSSSGSGTGQRGRVNWPTGYISVGPDRNSVTNIWNTVVKPFKQVYMVICGHNFAQYNVDDTNAAGKVVHQVLCDYQTLPNGGNGFLRIMEFRPALNQIYNTTYSPSLGRYMSNTSSPAAQISSDNTGMLDLTDKNGGEFSLATDFDTRFNSSLTVVSSQPTVSPAVGSSSIEDGTPVAVSATDNVTGQTRYRCTGWSLTGGTTASGTGKSTSFTMNGSTTLTWNWATEYYLDTLATGRGIVSVNSGYQAANASVDILAQPDSGAAFIRWSGDIAGCTIAGNKITVPMDRGRGPVTAEFTPIVPTHSVEIVSAYTSVSPSPATYPYEEGTEATFTAQDNDDGAGTRHVVTGWTATGDVNQTGTGSTATITVSGDFTLTWNWRTQYRLQTTVNGPGSIGGPAEQWIDAGAPASVTATANAGAAFTLWTGDTGLGTATGTTFSIPGMTRPVGPLMANFMTGLHTLTIVSPQSTTTPAAGAITLAHGVTVNFSAVPAESGRSRFVPVSWTLTGGQTNSGTSPQGSFVMNADTTLTWTWAPQVLLEIASGVEGSVLPTTAPGWHALNEDVTLQAVTAPGFQFSRWNGDVPGNPTTATISLHMDAPRKVAAEFTPVKAVKGTPKWWLDQHAKVINGDYTAAENTDTDGDGKTAWQEFVAGTDDLDATKVYRVNSVRQLAGGTGIELSWAGHKDRLYTVWSSTNLKPPFDLVVADVPAVEPTTTVTVPASVLPDSQQFYHVEAKLAPSASPLAMDAPALTPDPMPNCLQREMRKIPAGSFVMGDTSALEQSAMPTHGVSTAAFFMDKFEVSVADWQCVVTWANTHGYDLPLSNTFNPPSDHPAPGISWYDAAKWCNARSEMEGRVPAYYTDTATTDVYRTGTLDLVSANVNWAGNGYRLPTEAEWEKACRGGLSGKLYSWGDEDPINRANHWQFLVAQGRSQDGYPISTPVGSFNGTQAGGGPDSANAYGLYDMTGNAWEWCWDRNASYVADTQFDPKGPDTGTERVTRGGSWWNNTSDLLNCHRYPFPPIGETVYGQISFRCMRPAGPNE